jgi:putative phosphoserine phosphatase/1-acylglycerol-3-phosphate O-acyltransferase
MTATALRLPGSVAEVEASPEGPRIGAFFDLDGSLIAGHSARHVSDARFRRPATGAGDAMRPVGAALDLGVGRVGFEEFLSLGAGMWEGRSHQDLEELGLRLFRDKTGDLIYPEVRELVRAHRRRGHTVVLASSASTYQVEPLADYLGIDRVLCNRFVVDDGTLTGEVEQPVLWGEGKVEAVQRLAEDHGIMLGRSFFYADGDEDEPLMHLVGHPRPTNPAPHLAQVASRRGWPVLRFTSRNAGGLQARVRFLAGLGAALPAAAVGAAGGVVRRDKRVGLNVAGELWLPALLAINGVKVNVVGLDNVWAARPAVFVFNHRNNFDAFIAASIVRRDFVVVAHKDLAADRIMGPLGRLVDAAFADYSTPRAATATRKEMTARAGQGLSLLVAPEVAPSDTGGVGAFATDAFRIAMSTHLPVVPVVIRNADLLGGRHATTVNPGTVDVAVLPALDVGGWAPRGVARRAEGVRQLFLQTLDDWPTDAGRGAATTE